MTELQLALRRGVAAAATGAFFAVLAVVPARAASHIVDVVWSNSGRFEHAANVPAGKFVELCVKLDMGDKVRWSFEAAAPIDFNIHHHVGKETAFPAKQSQVTQGSGLLQVDAKENHCWMWTNKTPAEAVVRATLQR